MSELADLTPRDLEILRLAAAGRSVTLDTDQVKHLIQVEPPLLEANAIYGWQITSAGETYLLDKAAH
ncbi:hypothetical protein JCM19000A_28440 [Silvimonas sp. JCM 19000]